MTEVLQNALLLSDPNGLRMELGNKSRITPNPTPKNSVSHEGMIPGTDIRTTNDLRQQQSLPDRRYALNNDPRQQLKFYARPSIQESTAKLEPVAYKYRKSGVPYIPAWQILDSQPAKNLLDANPSNSTQVSIPDVYYQQDDRAANPRTEDPNAAQVQYERVMERTMTNYLLRDRTAWARHLIITYAQGHPDQFYKPVSIFTDELAAKEKLKYEAIKQARSMLRRPNGKFGVTTE